MTTFETFTSETGKGRMATNAIANLFAAIAMQVRAWKNRRSVARLLEWDAHMLGDIGLTQGDVYAAMATRASEDASTQLAMLSMERRFAVRAQARDRLNHASELRGSRSTYESQA